MARARASDQEPRDFLDDAGKPRFVCLQHPYLAAALPQLACEQPEHLLPFAALSQQLLALDAARLLDRLQPRRLLDGRTFQALKLGEASADGSDYPGGC